MPHRSPKSSSEQSSEQPLESSSKNPQLPRRSSPTPIEVNVPQSPAAPRWEQRYRAPSQREPLPREHHEAPEIEARRAPRWKAPDDLPNALPTDIEENEAAFRESQPSENQSQESAQWSAEALEDLARETMAQRGRKLSRRRARTVAARARRRHVEARRTEPKKKRPPIWRLFRAVALCLLAIAGVEFGIAALTSPRFSVQQITSDVADITPETSIESAKRSLKGQNFFRVHPQSVVQKLAKLPTVKSVSIVRQFDWPPHLHINIEERQPFARVNARANNGGVWWVVDESGVPFRRAEKQDDKLYAVSSKALTPEIGKPLKTENWTPVAEFARALEQDKQQGHDWALRAIYFDEHGFASLRLAAAGDATDRILVHLGTGPWDKKLERTRQTLAWLDAKGLQAETLNLISATRPVWTPRHIEPKDETEAKSSDAKANSENHPA